LIGLGLLSAFFVLPLLAEGADDTKKPETATLPPPAIAPDDKANVPLPEMDPVHGKSGPLTELWK